MYFFSGERKEEGVKGSYNLISVQCCCLKEPYKNNKEEIVSKEIYVQNKQVGKKQQQTENLSITFIIKDSKFNRLQFKSVF